MTQESHDNGDAPVAKLVGPHDETLVMAESHEWIADDSAMACHEGWVNLEDCR